MTVLCYVYFCDYFTSSGICQIWFVFHCMDIECSKAFLCRSKFIIVVKYSLNRLNIGHVRGAQFQKIGYQQLMAVW